jgi:electron transport complex protein RnfC
VIINAAECEPYITSDLRTMLDRSDDVLAGIAAVRKFLGVKNVIIGIETNKPEAIRLFEPLSKDADISIAALPSMYPQGGEKVLIYNITGRVVPEGKLPLDVGVIVLNVTTTAFIGSYLRTGMPLVEKCITVDGSAVGEPQNVIAPIGTPLRDIFAFCGGYKKPPRKILMGGPMLKNNNAVLALDEKDATLPEPTPCIRCGRCIEACPVNLMPTDLEHAYEQKNVEMLERLHIGVCMECGCCSYVCPARRNLVQANKLSKALVREKKVKK